MKAELGKFDWMLDRNSDPARGLAIVVAVPVAREATPVHFNPATATGQATLSVVCVALWAVALGLMLRAKLLGRSSPARISKASSGNIGNTRTSPQMNERVSGRRRLRVARDRGDGA